MKRKTQTIILALSLLIAVLGFGETAQAISFSGNTATSAPTTIDTFLTYTSGSFSNVDVAPGPGSTSLTDLGQFTLAVCSGNNCVENFNSDFILKITFTDPSVAGSPAQFTADISGTISRSGNSINIGNNSLLTIDFDNTVQTLNYTTLSGFGSFDLSVNDPVSYDATSQFGDTRTVTGQISNLTFTCVENCREVAAVPEPSTLLLLGAGLIVFARQMRSKSKQRAEAVVSI